MEKMVSASIAIDNDRVGVVKRGRVARPTIAIHGGQKFERLFGASKNDFERNELQIKKAGDLNSTIILKGANTCIAFPHGSCYFNSTGNPGMATGGSGDVLTGILTGLLAQGYSAKEASLLGVYLHGLAGDLAAEEVMGQEAMIASDIIQSMGEAWKALEA